MKYRAVEQSDVEMGVILENSVYNGAGDLLLKEGKVITT